MYTALRICSFKLTSGLFCSSGAFGKNILMVSLDHRPTTAQQYPKCKGDWFHIYLILSMRVSVTVGRHKRNVPVQSVCLSGSASSSFLFAELHGHPPHGVNVHIAARGQRAYLQPCGCSTTAAKLHYALSAAVTGKT